MGVAFAIAAALAALFALVGVRGASGAVDDDKTGVVKLSGGVALAAGEPLGRCERPADRVCEELYELVAGEAGERSRCSAAGGLWKLGERCEARADLLGVCTTRRVLEGPRETEERASRVVEREWVYAGPRGTVIPSLARAKAKAWCEIGAPSKSWDVAAP